MSQHSHFGACIVLSVLLTLAACAPTSRVILLPEQNGGRSAVEVRDKGGSVVLDHPYQTAETDSKGVPQMGLSNAKEVGDRYKILLSQQVAQPLHFTLRFMQGAQLTSESEALLREVVARASQRPGVEIFVTGHTDTVGTAEANDELSLQRAQAIRDRLIAVGIWAERIQAIGRGERELQVPTADEVEELANRRVEIEVR